MNLNKIIYSIIYTFSISILIYFLFSDNYKEAGLYIQILFSVILSYSLLSKSGAYFFTLNIFIFSPFLMVLRQFFIFYNILLILLIIASLLWLVKNTKIFFYSLIDAKAYYLFLFVIFYSVYGILSGNGIERFSKFYETVFATFLFLMMLTSINNLRKYSVYFILSSIALFIGVSKYIATRFQFNIEDENVGFDPSSISIGLSFSLLLILFDNSFWVSSILKKLKYFIVVLLIFFIILSTSRINFFIVLFALLFYILISKNKIIKIILSFFIVFSLSILISLSSNKEVIDKFFTKTFNNEKGLGNVTTGRSEMWEMTGIYLATADIGSILIGIGPGNGPDFTEEYSGKTELKLIMGRRFELHSLYLNILVEGGLIMFIFFILFIFKNLLKLFSFYKKYKTILPFISILSYLLYIISVSGLGLIPGFILSFTLINSNYLKLLHARIE